MFIDVDNIKNIKHNIKIESIFYYNILRTIVIIYIFILWFSIQNNQFKCVNKIGKRKT